MHRSRSAGLRRKKLSTKAYANTFSFQLKICKAVLRYQLYEFAKLVHVECGFRASRLLLRRLMTATTTITRAVALLRLLVPVRLRRTFFTRRLLSLLIAHSFSTPKRLGLTLCARSGCCSL
jgi:hypothetical protein